MIIVYNISNFSSDPIPDIIDIPRPSTDPIFLKLLGKVESNY